MNTPAHVVLNLTVLGREDKAGTIVPVTAGALLPDLPMMVFYAYAKLWQGISEHVIWTEAYHAADWQTVFNLFNSLPLIAVGYVAARLYGAKRIALVFASMALHCVSDLLLHHDDAHRHLFPLSDWRFKSPVSYWDPQHFGNIAGAMEAVAFIAGCAYLLTKYTSLQARLLVAALLLGYVVYWGYVFVVWM